MCSDEDVKTELFAVHTFKILVNSITKLEEQGQSKAKQWEILQNVLQTLEGFAKEKLESSIARNPDLAAVGDPANNQDLEFNVRTKYAPLVSVDVERSFSVYKTTLAPNRENFTFDNIEMVSVVRANSFLFHES